MMTLEEAEETPRTPAPKFAVLITAATKWEAQPLAAALRLKHDGPDRWHGEVAGRKVLLVKTGVGAKATADKLGKLEPSRFGLTISAGLCGAMHRDVRTGDIVADGREVELDLVKPLRETALKLAAPFHFGRILHTNIVLQPAAKKALGEEHRAVACDMETQALRRWTEGKAPAIGVRVVLDEMHEACPTDVPEGESFGALAKFALRNAKSMPSLLSTGLKTKRAMKTLSRFLKAYLETL